MIVESSLAVGLGYDVVATLFHMKKPGASTPKLKAIITQLTKKKTQFNERKDAREENLGSYQPGKEGNGNGDSKLMPLGY